MAEITQLGTKIPGTDLVKRYESQQGKYREIAPVYVGNTRHDPDAITTAQRQADKVGRRSFVLASDTYVRFTWSAEWYVFAFPPQRD